jgi:uncharacterized BrkB/YihY/UPF0761 family membrane protein
LLGLLLALVATSAGAAWARGHIGALGLVLSLSIIGAYFLAAAWVFMLLPHPPDATWRAMVPGAILLAISVQALHLATSLYLVPKVERASDFYGPLGIAMGLLAWLYVVGRVIVGAAMLNATLWERRAPPPVRPRPASRPA